MSEGKTIEINLDDLAEEHPTAPITNPLANIDTTRMLKQQHSAEILEIGSTTSAKSDVEMLTRNATLGL